MALKPFALPLSIGRATTTTSGCANLCARVGARTRQRLHAYACNRTRFVNVLRRALRQVHLRRGTADVAVALVAVTVGRSERHLHRGWTRARDHEHRERDRGLDV